MNDLSNNCYDLKRSALIASVSLIMISVIGPAISPDAKILIFSVPEHAGYVAIALVVLSCIYYNVSFLTTFYVESRNWQISTPSARSDINAAIGELHSISNVLSEQANDLRSDLSTLHATIGNFSQMSAERQSAQIGDYLSWNIEKMFEEKRLKANHTLFVAIDRRLHKDRALFGDHKSYDAFAKALAHELATELSADVRDHAVSRADEIGSAIQSRATFMVRSVQVSLDNIKQRLNRHDRSLSLARRVLKRLERNAARWKIAMNAKMYVFDLAVPILTFVAALAGTVILLIREF